MSKYEADRPEYKIGSSEDSLQQANYYKSQAKQETVLSNILYGATGALTTLTGESFLLGGENTILGLIAGLGAVAIGRGAFVIAKEADRDSERAASYRYRTTPRQ